MTTSLNGRKIVLGVSGGIAVYKAVELLRLLTRAGAAVHVVMTASAKKFVTPLTFETLSGRPVYHEIFDTEQSATTNRRGMYSIKNVPAGSNHTVTAEAVDFVTVQITDVEVFDGQTTTVDFVLEPSPPL